MNLQGIDLVQLATTISVAFLVWLLVYRALRKIGAPSAAAFVYSIGSVAIIAGLAWLTVPGIFTMFGGH